MNTHMSINKCRLTVHTQVKANQLLVLIRFILLAIVFSLSTGAIAQVFYATDFEGPGGGGEIPLNDPNGGVGSIVFLGGEIVNGIISPGDGTQNYQKYNNVILDSSPDARHSITGSNYSLKTHYKAGKNPTTGELYQASYQLNTTIISFPEVDTVYVRWYQKWGRDWVWPWDQQKLLKIRGSGSSQNFKVGSSNNYIYLTKRTPVGPYNPNGTQNETSVFSKLPPGVSQTDYRQEDSIIGNENFHLSKNRWYCIEVMVQSNTPGIEDAEFRYWIGDDLKLELTVTDNRGGKTGGISSLELQHVLQRGSSPSNQVDFDTPTWMDNISVSSARIYCPEVSVTSPSAPVLSAQ